MIRIIGIVLLLCSCSPQTRFDRLINKHPYLIETDTIIIRDTVLVESPRVYADTVVEYKELHDTIFLEKEQLRVKVYIDREKKVYIEGECDTVLIQKIIETKVPVKYYEKKPFYIKALNFLVGILLTLLLLYIMYRLVRKYLK
tara:strand:- start:3826 stop:4254 length:429 start_codon:yes stop_codon:yes gene_type:complete